VIVVVSPGYFEVDSIAQLSKTISEVKEFFNTNLQLGGLLFTMSDPTVNTASSLRILRELYGAALFNTIIPRNTDLRDAHFKRQDIFSYNPHAKGAAAYRKFMQEIML
jgi:chromosome partitioning protein